MDTELIFEGVPTRRLLDQVARLRGWDPAVATPIQSELDRMCQLVNHALERAWRFGWWPQLLLTRSVTYRPEWTSAAALQTTAPAAPTSSFDENEGTDEA